MRIHVHNDLSGWEWYDLPPEANHESYWQDVPRRLYLTFDYRYLRGTLSIGARTQGWLPWYGYLGKNGSYKGWMWWPVAWHSSSGSRKHD